MFSTSFHINDAAAIIARNVTGGLNLSRAFTNAPHGRRYAIADAFRDQLGEAYDMVVARLDMHTELKGE